jgi:lipopolysaccharide export system permease protein
MTLIDRYILRQLLGAFVMVLGVLTGIVWLTSSLRQLDLLVTQGQTLVIFLGITLLALPLLIALIAPFALFIAFIFVLNKLNTDSELIVMSASGLSQARLARPLIGLALLVTAVSYAATLVIVPATLRTLREAVTAARADLITQVVQPGRFTTVEAGLTLHVRDRSGGALLGVFVDDTRAEDASLTYLGQRGVVTRTVTGTFLVLENGQIIRRPKRGNQATSVISFESYAFNLSAFTAATGVTAFPAQERWTGELIELATTPQSDVRFAGRVRSELHDRFATPLYVLGFALIAFAFLGRARTTRQSRTEAVAFAIGTIVLVRILGFAASGFAQRDAWAIALIYLIPILTIIVGGYAALRSGSSRGGTVLRMPARMPNALARIAVRSPRGGHA